MYAALDVHGAFAFFEVLSNQPSVKGKAPFLSPQQNLHNPSYTTQIIFMGALVCFYAPISDLNLWD